MNKKENINQNELSVTQSPKLKELLEVNRDLKATQEEEKALERYLHSNIFNFVEGKEVVEDIFAIQNDALKIQDNLDRKGLILDRTVPLLEVLHVTKYYPEQKVPAVVNTSFKVYPGDFHVLVGSSGSGKTTLVDVILNNTQYEGEVLVNNEITTTDDNWKRFVGVVPAQPTWDVNKTVNDVVLDAAKNLGKSEVQALAYVRNSLEQFNEWQIRNKKMVELNMLTRKKVGLIIALISDPQLVILDDPLTGLQPQEQVDFLVLLAKLQKENRGVLVFSHLIDEFSHYANVMTILHNGRVFFSGLVKNLALENQFKFTISTTDNQAALNLLDNINCRYQYNKVAKTFVVKFDGQINVLLFQKECANKNIIIKEFRHAATNLADFYSQLLKVGTDEAMQQISDYYRSQVK